MYIQDTGYVSFHGRYAKITQRSFKLINHFIQAHKSLFLEMSVVGEKLPEKLPETETEPGMKQRRYEEEKENMKTKKMKIKGLRCRGLGPSVGEDVGSNFGFVDQLNKINPDIGEDAEQASHAATGMTSAHIAEGLGLDGCLDRLTSFNKFKEEDVRLCEHLNDWLQQQLFHPLTQDQWERVTAAKRALGEDAAPVEALGRFCDDTSFQESVDHSAFDKAGLTHSLGEDTDRIMRQAGWFDVLDEEMYPQAVEDPLGETATELRRMVLSQFAARKEQD